MAELYAHGRAMLVENEKRVHNEDSFARTTNVNIFDKFAIASALDTAKRASARGDQISVPRKGDGARTSNRSSRRV